MKKNIRLSKTLIIRLFVMLILIFALMIMKKIESDFLVYSNGAKTLDMRFGYNVSDVLNLFTMLRIEGRSIYVEYLCYDFIFIASFAIVQNYILKFAMGKEMLKSNWRILLFIAYFRGFFDVIENIIILILLNRFPSMLSFLITIASNVTRFKFILLGIWLLVIPIILVARLIMKKKQRGVL